VYSMAWWCICAGEGFLEQWNRDGMTSGHDFRVTQRVE
jgi:imidazole glycerol phosphate synthase subunit HisF